MAPAPAVTPFSEETTLSNILYLSFFFTSPRPPGGGGLHVKPPPLLPPGLEAPPLRWRAGCGHQPTSSPPRGWGANHHLFSVPRLGGNTRRGETFTLPTAHSHPTLPGGGAARAAVRCAQLFYLGSTRAEPPGPISLRGLVRRTTRTGPRETRSPVGDQPVFLNTPLINCIAL